MCECDPYLVAFCLACDVSVYNIRPWRTRPLGVCDVMNCKFQGSYGCCSVWDEVKRFSEGEGILCSGTMI
jgi:hypothetical protein